MTAIDVTGAGYEPVGGFEIDGRSVTQDEVAATSTIFSAP